MAGFKISGKDNTEVLLAGGGSKALTDFALSTALSGYLPLSGGTLNNGSVIDRTGTSVAWVNGRKNPIIKTTSYTGYNAILSMKTTNGSWDLGVYSNDIAYLTYITDTNYSASNNEATYLLVFPKKNGTIATTSDLSSYLPLAGGTMTGAAPISFTVNKIALNFRDANYKTDILYMTSGNEALVFSTQQPVTSFIFKSGLSLSDGSGWNTVFANSTPTLLLKGQSAYINGFLNHDVSPAYNLYVGGTSYFSSTINAGSNIAWDSNSGNESGGWNILTSNYGLKILNTTVANSQGNVAAYATGLHVSGTYWYLISYERSDEKLHWRGGNSEGVKNGGWKTILDSGNISSYAITSVADRLYSSLVTVAQTDLTWIKGIATTSSTNRSFLYNTSGNEYSYLTGFRNDGVYGAILKMGYSDRYLRILRKDNSGWKSTDWETIYSGYSDYSGKVYGSYSGDGGKQGPSYFGKNYAGFLMSNESINGYTNYTNWLYMDNYAGNDVGGATAIGVARTAARAFIMLSDANRTSWNNVAEIITTANISSYISDSDTWKPANTGQEGYVPKLAINNTAMTNAATDLVLTYKYNTTETTPVWRKLPDAAFQSPNNGTITFYSLHSGLNSGNAYSVGSFSANLSGDNVLILKAGNNITLTGDATNHIITITSSYSNDNTTSALYVGGSGNITSNSAQSSNGNVYLSLRESSGTYYSHKITGSGGTTVTSDSSGNITINSTSSASYNVVSSSDNGLAPKVTTTNSNVSVGTGYYFLATSSSTSTPAWYKLPTNAFYNDNSWRPVYVESQDISSNTLTLKGGTGISLSNSSGTVTINATQFLAVSSLPSGSSITSGVLYLVTT